MSRLVFYRQKRNDGSIRTGVELDDETIAHQFEEPTGDRDPVLLWYVDLRCEGSGVPSEPKAAALWLLDQSLTIRHGFRRFAEKMRFGADVDLYSIRWSEFESLPDDVEMTIVCSASNRIAARGLAEILADIGDRWREILVDELDIVIESQHVSQ